MKWDAQIIGHAVHHQLLDRRCVLVLPNSYWTGYEADLLGVSMDGRLIEVEIKISRGDFRADYAKGKWWHRPWRETWPTFVGPPRPPLQWPPKVWKHYYALPADIWTPELLDAISPASGVLLLHKSEKTGAVSIDVIRRAKPSRQCHVLTQSDALNLARLCSVRMWDALRNVDRLVRERESA